MVENRGSALERRLFSATTTVFSPSEEEARAVGWIITKSRLAQGWNPLPQTDQMAMVAAWFEVLAHAGVPVAAYDRCYLSAIDRRSELKADGKTTGPLAVCDLVAEWRKLKRRDADRGKSRLLPDAAATACERCFGTGREEMPDGSVRSYCRHLPLAPDEIEARAASRARTLERMRAVVTRLEACRPSSTNGARVRQQALVCDLCGRRVHTLGGWTRGERCGALCEGPSPGGGPVCCGGRMV